MPELPDVEAYRFAIERRVLRQPLTALNIVSPFFVRSIEPPVEDAVGREVVGVERLGKRIALALDGGRYLVMHLMIAGRFRWADAGAKPPGRMTLATFTFPTGTLAVAEFSAKKRASLHYVVGKAALAQHRPAGLDVLICKTPEFARRLRSESHTLKRALIDPRLFDGLGNAYSDEILHAARLSPIRLTSRVSDEEVVRLRAAARGTLEHWIAVLGARFAEKFPGAGDITAFRPEFAVHGKYGLPCPNCGTTVQRIRYAENETNYCAVCQTEGKLLADRSLSRLLKGDWPSAVE